jgi:hypothetical protein
MIFLGLFGTLKNFPVPVLSKIELIPVKFLRDSCGIPAFQTGPRNSKANHRIGWHD